VTEIRVDVQGQNLVRAFGALPAALRRRVQAAVLVSAREVARDVRASLRKAGRTGAIISARGRGRKRRASAPGEPPARRTGLLARSIRVVDRTKATNRRDVIGADVRASVPYSMALEYGRKAASVGSTHRLTVRQTRRGRRTVLRKRASVVARQGAMAARPFLGPARARQAEATTARLAAALREALVEFERGA